MNEKPVMTEEMFQEWMIGYLKASIPFYEKAAEYYDSKGLTADAETCRTSAKKRRADLLDLGESL